MDVQGRDQREFGMENNNRELTFDRVIREGLSEGTLKLKP